MKRLSVKKIRSFLAVLLILALLVPATAFAAKSSNKKKSIDYYITVDQTNQIVTVYRIADKAIVRQMLCSAGLNGATPDGTYGMPKGENYMDRSDWYHFKGFRCYAKYPTRIFKGILFHSITYNDRSEDSISKVAIEEYGHPASHGCIRLQVNDSKWIQDNCPIGTKVTIYHSGIKDQNLWNLLYSDHYTEESGMTYDEFLGGAITRYSSEETIFKLQQRLHELGYFTGKVDGSWDEDTTDALLLAQVATDSEISGNVEADFIEKINAEDAPAIPGYDFNECMHEPGIKLLQRNLKALGLFTGDVNGVFDFALSEAVAKFQSCYGYDPDGMPNVIEQEAIQYEADRVVEVCGSDASAELKTETVETATVHYDKSIRLREKPDTDSKEVDNLSNGTRMLLIEKGKDWSKLQYGSKVGFMKNKYLEFGVSTFTTIEATGSKGSYSIGLGLKAAQKGSTSPAEKFKDYYEKLKSSRKAAVKEASKLASSNSKAYTTPDSMVVNTGAKGVTLNLRAEPSTDGAILTELSNGTSVDVISFSGDWAQVNVNGVRGYVVSQYLSASAVDHSALMSGEPTAATVNTTEGFAYVYADANKNSEKTGYVTTGTTISAYGSSGGFTYIRYNDRQNNTCYGFVKNEAFSAGQVSFAVDTSDEPMDDGVDMVMYAFVIDSVSTAPVCESDSEESKVIASLPSGTKVTVLEADDDSKWALIQYGDLKGYMENSFLRFDSEYV